MVDMRKVDGCMNIDTYRFVQRRITCQNATIYVAFKIQIGVIYSDYDSTRPSTEIIKY